MFRYLPGIVLVQIVTLALFWVNNGASLEQLLLRVGLPALIVSGVTALWLSMIGRMEAEKRNTTLREQHAKECARLNREIERARSDVLQQASADRAQLMERASTERERLVKQTHKQLMAQERSASRRANIKVGLAFMGVTAFGVMMLITELLTLGLLTITTAGGAMGGYLYRWRQSRHMMDRLGNLPESPSGGKKLTLPSPIKGQAKRDNASLPPIDVDATGSGNGGTPKHSDFDD